MIPKIVIFLVLAIFGVRLQAQTTEVIYPGSTDTVYSGSTRTLYSNTCSGTNTFGCTVAAGVNWTATCGTLDSTTNVFVRWTAPAAPTTCNVTATANDGSMASDVQAFTVIVDNVTVNMSPFNITLFNGQYQILQPLIFGSTNLNVTWAVTMGPVTTGVLSTTQQQAVFHSTTPGQYQITATSVADGTKSAIAYITVTSNPMPSLPLVSNTEPVDCTATGSGTTYDVTTNADFNALPWQTFGAGDTIRVHWSATPINVLSFLGYTSGTAAQPIRMCGVYDPVNGLPQITGVNATIATAFNNTSYWGGGFGVGVEGLFIFGVWNHNNNGGTSAPNGFFIVEGLQLGHGIDPAYSGTSSPGSSFYPVETPSTLTAYSRATACLSIRNGHDIVFRGNELVDCGNDAFLQDNDAVGSRTQFVLFQGNWLHVGSSTNSSQTQHTAYLQGSGIVVQGNYFDFRRNGGTGSTLKTRIIREYIRFNFMEPAARIMDMVEPEDVADHTNSLVITAVGNVNFPFSEVVRQEEAYDSYDWVYGNIFFDGADPNSSANPPSPFHYSADDTMDMCRDATLLFYNNTENNANAASAHQDQFALDECTPGTGFGTYKTGYFPYVRATNNAINLQSITGGNIFAWGLGTSNRIALDKNWIRSTWCVGATQANCGLVLTSGYGVTLGSSGGPPYQTGNTNVWLSGVSNLVTGTSIPFNSTTYFPNIGSPILGIAVALPTPAAQLPANMQYDLASRVIVPRSSNLTANPTTMGAKDLALFFGIIGGKVKASGFIKITQ